MSDDVSWYGARATYHAKLEKMSRSTGFGRGDLFRAFVTMASAALARRVEALDGNGFPASEREQDYLDAVARIGAESARQMPEVFSALVTNMEANEPFCDLLGPVYLAWCSRSKAGEVYTPPHICDAMAEMIGPKRDDPWPTSVLEPSCGSGQMILSAAKALVKAGGTPLQLKV